MGLRIVSLVLLLLVATVTAQNCAQGDSLECASSLCFNYYIVNSTCNINATSTCIAGQTFFNGACVTCSGLMSTNCSTICLDFYFFTPSGSSSSICTSCESIFGTNCIQCTGSVCLACRFSSNTTLATNSLTCINQNCNDANCIQCYSSGTKCYKCKSGFTVDNAYACAAASCTISNCMNCDGSNCQQCFPNYILANTATICNPQCTDINCLTCIAPGICSACISTAYSIVSGVCTLNCTLISIAQCLTCTSFTTCSSCNPGFTLTAEQDFCQATCSVANCADCRNNQTACTSCDLGFDLVSTTSCVASFCYIQYCATCGSLSTCGTCITGFTLANSNTTCTSDCQTGGLINCLFCSSTTVCTVCKNGYIVSGGNCVLVCAAITNCIACTSATVCAACAADYALSANSQSCTQVCIVQGCSVCPSSVATTCTTCMTGYTLTTRTNGNSVCQLKCDIGFIDTGSGGTVNCQQCSATLPQCNTCSFVLSVIHCDTCVTGYFLNGFTCDLCSGAITNCLICSNSVTCTECASGFKEDNGVCTNTACNAAVTNCFVCSATNLNQCSVCNPGFTFNPTTLVCQALPIRDGYIFDQTTGTYICPSGTYELGTVCTPCTDQNCNNCTSNSVCNSCVEGYYPIGSTCNLCIVNCKTCTSGSKCTQCDDGYSIDENQFCVAFGGGQDCAVSTIGIVFKCQKGCRVCLVGSRGGVTATICLRARRGYSIVAGVLTRCAPSCKTCDSPSPSTCSSCYRRKRLVSGSCVSCLDPNAIKCSRKDLTYAFKCVAGYTAAGSALGSAGTCRACATYCRKCDKNGPGQCDSKGCNQGAVQLTGTTNCSICFNGCSRCSSTDTNTCLSCGFRRYLDATSGLCTRCQTGCKACVTSATNCLSCDLGYWRVGTTCLLIPANCITLNSTGSCTACLAGYSVNTGSDGCNDDLTCNTNSSCTVCPSGYSLTNSNCVVCTITNCVQCSATNSSLCTGCGSGFFLDTNNVCVTCISNCLRCDSDVFCTRAADGFFIPIDDSGAYEGTLTQCNSPCATCVDQADFCLTCISGYTLDGSECQNNVFIFVSIIFGPTASSSIFASGDSLDNQVFKGIKSLNRLGFAIFSILSSTFRNGHSHHRSLIRFKKFSRGSLAVNMNVGSGGFSSGASASSSFTNSASSSSIDGVTYLSSSVVANGYTTTSTSSTNLGLVLGLSIPLSILLVLIIVILVYSFRKDTDDQEEGGRGKFFTEDVLQKQQEI